MDNSEWMRNGDYPPTRFQAQADAVNLICGAKTQSNPENTVGVLTMAGKGPRVLITPTNDLGKILQALHGLEVGGEMNLTSGVQVAQLALKHRQNKHQRQRIVLFAGSPVLAEKNLLEGIGKKLKKNNVALDIVSFGEEDGDKGEKLEALLNAVNSNDNSHIVHINGGERVLSDVLISSSIFTGDGEGGSGFAAAAAAGAAAAAAAAVGGGGSFEFGVDPNLDPELALALRVSMEEERARQEAAMKRSAEDATLKEGQVGESSNAADVPMSDAAPVEAIDKSADMMIDDDAALLEQALAMSMAEAAAAAAAGSTAGDLTMAESGGDDQDLAFALQMSMQEAAAAAASASQSNADMSKVLGDQSFVSSVLSSLPGVDPNDPSVRDVLASLEAEEEEQTKSKTDSKSKEGSS
jgi:26S proteasome regulatory subunit N10